MTEIYLYGDIDTWQSEVLGYELRFVDDEILLHINSPGGDVFAGVAMSNLIRNSGKKITAQIDGLCASAAVLISCACQKVSIAENALMMTHLPFVELENVTLNEKSLAQMQAKFASIKNSMIQTYKLKTPLTDAQIEEILNSDTWMTADDAVKLGFADEVIEAVQVDFDDAQESVTTQNHTFKPRNYLQFKNYFNPSNKSSILDKLKNFMNKSAQPPQNSVEEIRLKEISRIKTLNAARSDNPHANAILDVAIAEGKTLNSIQKYLDAVKKIPALPPMQSQILDVIKDQLECGSESVTGSADEDKNSAALNLLKKYV